MLRLRRPDALLLATLVPFALLCLALHVKQVASGRLAWVPMAVSRAPDGGAPVFDGFWPTASPPAENLSPGDRLVAVGDRDLTGAGPLRFVADTLAVAASAGLRVPLRVQRGDDVHATTLELSRVAYPWRSLPLSLGFLVCGVLVVVRRPRSLGASAFFRANLLYGLHWLLFAGGPPTQTYLWAVTFTATASTVFPMLLLALRRIPEHAAVPTSALGRLWPWAFVVFGPACTSWVFGVPLDPEDGSRATFVLNVAFIVAGLAVLTGNFRAADRVGRRQVKWVVWGFYVGTAPVLAASLVASLEPKLGWLYEISMIAPVAIPICILIAIVRSNFFDVDRLITATASYSLLSVLLVAGVLTIVPRLSAAASATVDVDPQTAQVLLSLGLAALVVPAQRFLLASIQRLFFEERHALEQGVQQLLRDLSTPADPRAHLELVGRRLAHLLQAESCVLFAIDGDRYRPILEIGPVAAPPVVSADVPLAHELLARSAPARTDGSGSGREALALGGADRALVEGLGAEIFVPIRRRQALAAFLALGPKRSGDVYTATDLALLGAVAERLSASLLAFDDAELQRRTREMNEALRRYVPGAIVSGLESGDDLQARERDVSVLFVDIRGYTSFAEGRLPEAIFSTINQYTETVSAVVRRHGGTIVEFNGDGMMAVFGAPQPLADKEAAAVRAALEIAAAVPALQVEGVPGGLRAGVGVASGPAFVGSIRSVDRLIWSAIGNTTNLAARLQASTKDFDTTVVIDARTAERAGPERARFAPRTGTAIRGRSKPQDLWILRDAPLKVDADRTPSSSSAP